MEALLNCDAVKSLKKLEFRMMSGVDAENLVQLSACENLEHLGLAHCIPEPEFGDVDENLELINTALIQVCPELINLRVVDFTFCGVFTKTIDILASCCPVTL